ncbi:hypothetical protein Tco_1098895 [Tanacetum coccineum]
MPFSEGELPVTYLGVPLISSRLLNKDYKILVEKARTGLVIGKTNLYHLLENFNFLINVFLWCNGEYKRGKAKVAWEDICLPKWEGGLGLRNLDVFNIALLTTHIWNIVSNKESLWVRWIHTYKLKGRTIWDIPLQSDLSWGWLKLLQIRDLIRPFVWNSIGNGKNTSIWYDNWCNLSPLFHLLSNRDITREGFHNKNNVADLISNGVWLWPQSWIRKAPELAQIVVPITVESSLDTWQWKDMNGTLGAFSVAKVWEAIRNIGAQVD